MGNIFVAWRCNPDEESLFCFYGQSVFCNLSFVALPCESGGYCAGTTGFTCVAYYCQPASCTATGQCVYGKNAPKMGIQKRVFVSRS